MMVYVIVTPTLVVYAVMMIIMDIGTADYSARDTADDRARRPGDDGSPGSADDGSGHRAGERLGRDADNSANRCKGQQKSFHVESTFLSEIAGEPIADDRLHDAGTA
jgi:hypothetical protein